MERQRYEKIINSPLVIFILADSLKLFATGRESELKLIKTDIAWPSDRKIKFNNPPGALNDTGGKYILICCC